MFKKILFSIGGVAISAAVLSVSLLRMTQHEVWAQMGIVSNTSEPTASSSADISGVLENRDYYLVYPGILPDHPLYSIKMVRDRIRLWLTRNEQEKSELLLLYGDKRIGAAHHLAQGGEMELALKTATKAVHYLKIVADKELSEEGKKKVYTATYAYEEILDELHDKVGDPVKSLVDQLNTDVGIVREKTRL